MIRTLRDIKAKANDLITRTGSTRPVGQVGILISHLIGETPHDGGITQSHVEDLDCQMVLWLLGRTDSRPSWSDYPQMRVADMDSSHGEIAMWALESEM